MLHYQGLTSRGGARLCKSLIYNNLDRKDRSTKQEDEHHGECLCDVCHNDLCHSLALATLDCASEWTSVDVERYLCHNVSKVRRHSRQHFRLRGSCKRDRKDRCLPQSPLARFLLRPHRSRESPRVVVYRYGQSHTPLKGSIPYLCG